jgi:2-methylisocitrate lyase-like PEP mutase family enzyme
MTAKQNDIAKTFRALHDGKSLLVLPNAWDAGSARLVESAGARAVATSSAAVAWSHGYPDGDALPVKLLAATTAAIARVIRVPLSVDSEGGYSKDPAAAAEAIGAVIDAGAVGINIEDADQGTDLLCAKIERIRDVAAKRGADLFINARTDVYLFGLVSKERRLEETLARAARYRAAGADGLFVPAVTNADEIRTIAAECGLPLNVLARPGLSDGATLASLGVRRLSAGSQLAQRIWLEAGALARKFVETGCSDPLFAAGMAYGDLNALMTAQR